MTKSHLGRKGLLPYYRWQSIMKKGVRTQTRGRDLSRGQEDVLLLVHSASFPQGPRLQPSLIKKLPHGMSTTQSDRCIFPNCHFFFSDNYCVSIYIKPWTTKGEQEVLKRGVMQSEWCKEEHWSQGHGERGGAGKKGKAALVCFPAVPCCCTKTLTKCNLGKGRVYLAQSILRAARAGM